MTLGQIIKNYRYEHGYSMEKFAELSGISRAYISLLEKDKHPDTGEHIQPSIDIMSKAATAMNMEFNELFNKLDDNTFIIASFNHEGKMPDPLNQASQTIKFSNSINGTIEPREHIKPGYALVLTDDGYYQKKLPKYAQDIENKIIDKRTKTDDKDVADKVDQPDYVTQELKPEEKDGLISLLAKLNVDQLQKVRNYINMLIDLKQ